MDTTRIEGTDLPQFAKDELISEYIGTVGELLQYSFHDLKMIPLRPRTIEAIMAFINRHGLQLNAIDQTISPPQTTDMPLHPGAKRDLSVGTKLRGGGVAKARKQKPL